MNDNTILDLQIENISLKMQLIEMQAQLAHGAHEKLAAELQVLRARREAAREDASSGQA